MAQNDLVVALGPINNTGQKRTLRQGIHAPRRRFEIFGKFEFLSSPKEEIQQDKRSSVYIRVMLEFKIKRLLLGEELAV